MDATQNRPIATSAALAVFGGGADRLDGVLEHAVAPAVNRAAPEHWSFLRWNGDGGPHVRVALGGEGWGQAEVDELADHITAGLERAAATSAREPLLPRPASQRVDDARVGVERVQCSPDQLPADPLHQLCSELVLAVLPTLEDGRQRCALGLNLMATISQSALGRHAGPGLWHDVARRRTKTDGRGQRLLASLSSKAGDLGPELIGVARELRRDDAIAEELGRYADGCRELGDPAAVRRHAHLACNRLGVTPLEEVLLALVLAGATEPAGEPGRAVVELDRVSRQEGERTVLDGVSLTVYEGEVFVILGPPGTGKSSLLGIAAGLRVASGGDVRVLGRNAREARRELTQAPALAIPDGELAEERTTRETVELRLQTDGGDGTARVDAVLEEVGLHEEAGTAVGDLQPGQRRRLALACALVHRPVVLLLDEPTAGLSPVERDEIWRVIGRRREHGGTTVLTTTSLQEALCVGDRAGLILDGALRATGPPAHLAEEFFPERSLLFHVEEKADRALLEDLPEVHAVEIDERADHWAVDISTRQPRELLALLRADPEFPEMLNLDEEQLAAPFVTRQEA